MPARPLPSPTSVLYWIQQRADARGTRHNCLRYGKYMGYFKGHLTTEEGDRHVTDETGTAHPGRARPAVRNCPVLQARDAHHALADDPLLHVPDAGTPSPYYLNRILHRGSNSDEPGRQRSRPDRGIRGYPRSQPPIPRVVEHERGRRR